jgi:hypothetical protein
VKEIIKQTLIAAVTAAIVMLVFATPEIITQLIVFMPVFAVTFGALHLLSKKTVKKE